LISRTFGDVNSGQTKDSTLRCFPGRQRHIRCFLGLDERIDNPPSLNTGQDQEDRNNKSEPKKDSRSEPMFAGLDGALFSGGFARRREMRFQKLVDALSTDRSSGRLGVEQHRPRAPLALSNPCSH
jgi:hypothetical protein